MAMGEMRTSGRGRWRAGRIALAAMTGLAAGAGGAEEHFLPLRGGERVIGEVRWVEAEAKDTLVDIAKRHGVGYEELRSANPTVDPWLPGAGTDVMLPTRFVLPDWPHEGIVLNVAEMRMYYFPPAAPEEPAVVRTYPVSVGRGDWSTPVASTRVTAKVADPVWTPPASIRAEHAAEGDILPAQVPPGEDNPLGRFALRLGLPAYLIHGTNKSYGIGMQVTHGCVRLYPRHIEALFDKVPVGTPVHIINQPFKAGWRDGRLYLEVHPPLEGMPYPDSDYRSLLRMIMRAAGPDADITVDWDKAAVVAAEASGVPTVVGERGVYGAAPAGQWWTDR